MALLIMTSEERNEFYFHISRAQDLYHLDYVLSVLKPCIEASLQYSQYSFNPCIEASLQYSQYSFNTLQFILLLVVGMVYDTILK